MTVDILYIVSSLRPSGPTNQLYYLLKYLDDGFNVKIVTLSPEPDDSELPRFRKSGIEYETLGLSRMEGVAFGPKRLQSVVREHDPDIVQSQGIRADTLSALMLSEYPRVTTIRNYPYDDYPAKFGRILGSGMAWEHVQAFKRLDYPVACSKTILRMVGPHKIRATPIQNGVDHYTYTPAAQSKKLQLREKLKISESGTVYVSVGSLIPRKDPMLVVRGFLEADTNDSELIFLGDGPLRIECEQATSQNSSIRFEGEVSNVVDYLKASDYFLSASKSEGLPNAVMEALAVGLPVCLSDIGPHKEIMNNSNVGTIFTGRDPARLGAKIRELASFDYDQQSEAAREISSTALSAERMSSEYQSLYVDILNEPA